VIAAHNAALDRAAKPRDAAKEATRMCRREILGSRLPAESEMTK